MDVKDKLLCRYKLAISILKIIEINREKDAIHSVTSLRKLAASSSTEYAIIQKITTSKKDPQFSTFAAIIDGFGLSLTQLAKVYDSVTEAEIIDYQKNLEKKKNANQNK